MVVSGWGCVWLEGLCVQGGLAWAQVDACHLTFWVLVGYGYVSGMVWEDAW